MSQQQRRVLAFIVVVALFFGAIGLAVISTTTPYLGYLRNECAIGVIGAAASITVRGTLAGRTCHQAIADYPRQYYERSELPIEPVVCEFTRDNQRIIVRDSGALKLVGNNICTQIQRAPGQ